MNPTLKNILAVIAGWLIGSIVNMGLIQLGHKLMPVPGLDVNDMESFASIFPTLEPKYFLFPFLAHALGALIGAVVAARLAANNKMKMGLIVGAIFLLGGIAASYLIPAPTWFTVADLVLAYIPMGWLGGKLGAQMGPKITT